MGVNTKITLGALKNAAHEDVARLLAEVHAAVDNAPDGAIIAGSEEAVREAMARFRERVYEKAVQLKADAGASAFSPSDGKGPS
jgi:malonyl CoA-acyl carrier protein transacylase